MESLDIQLLKLVKQLKLFFDKNNEKFTIAESATCGLIASFLAKVPGISRFFLGGFVVYSKYSKHKVLKINNKLLNKFGTVSCECAEEMVTNACKIMKCNFGISVTGNAGPNCIENKDLGLFYIGIKFNKNIHTHKINLNKTLNRDEMRYSIAIKAILLFLNYLDK